MKTDPIIDDFTDAFIDCLLHEANTACGVAAPGRVFHAEDIAPRSLIVVCGLCAVFQKIAGHLIADNLADAGAALHSRITGGHGFFAEPGKWHFNAGNLNRLAITLARTRLPGDFLIANENDALVFRARSPIDPIDFPLDRQ